ncbi:MAG: hypothetical protein WC979_09765 [Candidatus Pacearchaeota archaeon]
MTPDEVVEKLGEIKEEDVHHRLEDSEIEAIQSAISLIQDYQKLRERVSVEKIAEIIYDKETFLQKVLEPSQAFLTWGQLDEIEKSHYQTEAHAIVTYLQ